jgi:hypothetical protein
MNQDLNLAVKCFSENLRLSANPSTEAEKYNLYTGLAALASGFSAEFADLDQQVRQLNNRIAGLESQRT